MNEERPDRGQPSSSYTGDGIEDLADRFASLARSLQDEDDVQTTLDAIVHAAVGTVPGVDSASISAVRRRREVMTIASSDELPRAVDHAQYETGQGPCLDSLYHERTVRLSDLASDERWPEFTLRASELGVGSMLTIQLFVTGDDLGALNLVSRQVDAFDDESEHVGLLFASHAAVAMSEAREVEQLRSAVSTRDLIGQAKGILMERFKITGDQAFTVLTRASQDSNRRLHQVADELVHSGSLPGNSTSP